ncbi:hypothetical protein ACN28G_12040 [Micromonospora sp. WMMA1923]|uniref:hypothetical protein n=1 Tax=Micromonospora sp. WMMA1923 TaxID=3404125 RepID=UPI003B952D1E
MSGAPTPARPRPGDLLIVDRRASVQFAGARALIFRVVSVSDQPTYHGWVWLTGYVVDQAGLATAKREIYVQFAGLRPAAPPPLPTQSRRRATDTLGPTPHKTRAVD